MKQAMIRTKYDAIGAFAAKCKNENEMLKIDELVLAAQEVEQEQNISAAEFLSYAFEAIKAAYKELRPDYFARLRQELSDNDENFVRIVFQEDTNELGIFASKVIVDVVSDSDYQISLEESRRNFSDVEIGEWVEIEVTPPHFVLGRVGAQTAKQFIKQKLHRHTIETHTTSPMRSDLVEDFLNCMRIELMCTAGETLAERGDFISALECYEQAWDLLPHHKERWSAAEWIFCGQAEAYFAMKDFTSALDHLQKITTLQEILVDRAFVHLRLGQCYFELGQTAKANLEFSRARASAGEVIFLAEDEKYLEWFENFSDETAVPTGNEPPFSGTRDTKQRQFKHQKHSLANYQNKSTDAEMLLELRELVDSLVTQGFSSDVEIADQVISFATREQNYSEEISKQLKDVVAEYVKDSVSTHLQNQNTWTAATDCQHLDDAFAELEKQGVVARQNFTCCNTCGHAEMAFEMAEYRRQNEKVPIGYVFYHIEDTEFASQGAGLFLSFGSVDKNENSIGSLVEKIVDVLAQYGLSASWNGNINKRIQIKEFDWKRHRSLN